MTRLFELQRRLIAGLAFMLAAAWGSAALAAAALPPGFSQGRVAANGVELHYVKGGAGPAVVLLHGYPQSWYEWRHVMPALAQRYTVVAVDLRGVGGSTGAEGPFDKATLAADVRGLVAGLNLGKVSLVGHDIGGMVAYAYARQWPQEVERLVVLEAPVPGVGPWDRIKGDPRTWHFVFHQQPNLPESLVQGRQEIYFRQFMDVRSANPRAMTDEDVRVFAEAYGTPEALRAGFEFYRAFPADEAFGQCHEGPADMPVLILGGQYMAGPFVGPYADGFKARGFSNVRTGVIAGSGHWVPEEKPEELTQALLDFLAGR